MNTNTSAKQSIYKLCSSSASTKLNSSSELRYDKYVDGNSNTHEQVWAIGLQLNLDKIFY